MKTFLQWISAMVLRLRVRLPLILLSLLSLASALTERPEIWKFTPKPLDDSLRAAAQDATVKKTISHSSFLSSSTADDAKYRLNTSNVVNNPVLCGPMIGSPLPNGTGVTIFSAQAQWHVPALSNARGVVDGKNNSLDTRVEIAGDGERVGGRDGENSAMVGVSSWLNSTGDQENVFFYSLAGSDPVFITDPKVSVNAGDHIEAMVNITSPTEGFIYISSLTTTTTSGFAARWTSTPINATVASFMLSASRSTSKSFNSSQPYMNEFNGVQFFDIAVNIAVDPLSESDSDSKDIWEGQSRKWVGMDDENLALELLQLVPTAGDHMCNTTLAGSQNATLVWTPEVSPGDGWEGGEEGRRG